MQYYRIRIDDGESDGESDGVVKYVEGCCQFRLLQFYQIHHLVYG